MSKVFAQSVRDALLLFQPGRGVRASAIPNYARRTLLRNNLVDIVDGDEESVLELTKVGRFAMEILVELREAYAICDRMRADMSTGVFSGLAPAAMTATLDARVAGARRGEPAAEPPPLRSPARATCGTTNHDSFAVFLASLNAAGKNRWKDPGFTGEAPVRAGNRAAPGDRHE